MLRIAIITDQYPPQLSGVADSTAALEKELLARGHEIRTFAPRLDHAVLPKHVVPLTTYSFGSGMFNLVLPFNLFRALREFKPDVVHIQSIGVAAGIGIICAKRLNIPLVAGYHGSPVDYLKYFYLDVPLMRRVVCRAAAWYFNHADVVVAPSYAALLEPKAFGLRSVTEVISNPIDTIFRALNNREALKNKWGIGPRAIAVFGRIAREKNLDHTVHVCAEVAQKLDITLVFIGDGPYRRQLERLLSESGLKPYTRILGRLSGENLVEAINACELMLTSSTMEAQGMAILQSSACALPVVGARAGGVPEYIQDTITGFVVDPADTKTYVRRIIELLESPSSAHALGEAGMLFAKKFNPEQVAAQYEGAYQRAVHIAARH